MSQLRSVLHPPRLLSKMNRTRSPHHLLDIENLAMQISNNQPTTGMKYARKPFSQQKDRARSEILRLFTRSNWPNGLSILTMPSLGWRFEKQLLAMREGTQRRVHRTYICAIEREESIYRAGIENMPGAFESLAQLQPPSFASATMRTRMIARYHRCHFEDLAYVDGPPYDAAWLDFNGQLSFHRVEAIKHFFSNRLKEVLAITWLDARYEPELTKEIKKYEDSATWLQAVLGGHIISSIRYTDPVPMRQIILVKD